MPKRKAKKTKNLSKKLAYTLAIACISASIFLGLSLISYDPADPSPNHAVNHYTTNLAGTAGAYVADPLLQLFGVGAALLVISFTFWAVRLIKEQRLTLWGLRVAMLLVAMVSTATLAAFFTNPNTWPFSSLGGWVGYVMYKDVGALIGRITLASIAVMVTITAVILTVALKKQEAQWVGKLIQQKIKLIIKAIKAIQKIAKSTLKWLGTGLVRKQKTVRRKTYKKKEKIIEEPKVKASQPSLPELSQVAMKLKDGHFELPSTTFLNPGKITKASQLSKTALAQNAKLLEKVLADFNIQGKVAKVRPGPVVTLYELEPAAGTKSARVIGLADDIARSMSAVSARIAVIPGQNAIGIELPNVNRETVYFRDILEAEEYKNRKINVPLALGKDISGDSVIADLTKMPHLLVAGTTGSGKSVAINSMILSILYRMKPDQCRFIMIDPKMLELSVYEGIPHLLAPVVTEPSKAVVALKWVVREMENRYRGMSSLGVRNIAGYNKRIEEAIAKGEVIERRVQTGFEPETGKPIIEKVPVELKPLPFIVVVVDEMADLMLVAGKEIEGAIQRLAQMARAAGIHIIMATQRPSVDVITGVIKANFPTRISFQVTSKVDSRTILGEMGAEQLLGMGDMLYMAGGSKTIRVHGPFVDDKEVGKVVEFLKGQGEPDYVEEVTTEQEGLPPIPGMPGEEMDQDASLYDQAVAVVLRDKRVSTSYIQRQLKIGYNRAANLIEKMEEEGVISSPNHAGKREILAGENA